MKYEKIVDKYMKTILKEDNKLKIKKVFTEEEAKKIGDRIGVDWSKHSIKNFTIGINVELEHGTINSETNVTNDDPIITGKIAYAHMKEIPGTGKGDDYYSLLKKYVEKD